MFPVVIWWYIGDKKIEQNKRVTTTKCRQFQSIGSSKAKGKSKTKKRVPSKNRVKLGDITAGKYPSTKLQRRSQKNPGDQRAL